ncbi:hypothetical protein O3Q51_13540 [Cryomorphaceae bacterium 1068]|nr:hypothetical protein [Cryomorphaceae bacterium 1068]
MSGLKILICLFALITWGCSKDSDSSRSFSSIKLLDTSTDYLARTILTLPDGSVFMGCVGQEDEGNPGNYGTRPSLLAKYDGQSALEWVIELPPEVYVLWKCISLSNGHILAVGYDNERNSQMVGAVILDSEGTVLHTTSFFNQLSTSSSDGPRSTVDAIQIQDGRIILVIPNRITENGNAVLRVVSLDDQLFALEDINYENLDDLENRGMRQFSIEQDSNGDLLIAGTMIRTVGSENPFMGIIKLSSSLDVISSRAITSLSIPFPGPFEGNSRGEIASNIALDPIGYPVFVSSLRNPNDSLYEPLFNLRDQEFFMRAPQFELWNVNSNEVEAPIKQISGYPSNAIIQKLRSTSDGGYIMVGTCGVNDNQGIPSNYQLLIVKVDPSLNLQWLSFPRMQYATLGADIIESGGGYLVTGSQRFLGQTNKPFFLRINQSGIIE